MAKYCPKCGEKMYPVVNGNEKEFITFCIYSFHGCDRSGEPYLQDTGERLYRIETHCPTEYPWYKRIFNKYSSHHVRFQKGDLTKVDVLDELKDYGWKEDESIIIKKGVEW